MLVAVKQALLGLKKLLEVAKIFDIKCKVNVVIDLSLYVNFISHLN